MSRPKRCSDCALDAICALYDRRCGMYSGSWHEALASEYTLWTSLTQGQAVLDLACGTGMVTRRLQQVVGPDGLVVGIDISEGMLATAFELQKTDDCAALSKYIRADVQNLDAIEALTGTKGSWDVITCCSAITLLFDIEATVKHWATWLRCGGRLIVDIPAAGSEGGHLGPETLSTLSSEGLLDWDLDYSNSWLGADDRLMRVFQSCGMQTTIKHGGSYDERKIFLHEVDEWFDSLVASSFYDVRFLSLDQRIAAKRRFKQTVMSKMHSRDYIHEKMNVIVLIGIKT